MKTIKEIYEYREMIFSLVRRDLQGRYKGSILGFFWTFLNPLLQLCVYTVVFSIILRNDIEQYYLFLFVALVPWIFFSTSVSGGASVIWSQQDMVKKIYFPRQVLPITFVTSQFVNMFLSFLVVFFVLIISGKGISIVALMYMPIIMIVEYILCLGMAFITSALTVYLRDLEYLLSIITMAWQFLTPVMYSIDIVPEQLLPLFNVNPMTPIIIAYRDILYYKTVPQLGTLAHGTILGVFLLIVGWKLFDKLQKRFAEVMKGRRYEIFMKDINAIEVHDITKKFRVYLDRGTTLKELTLFKKRRKYEERKVLDGISFEVKKGEAIGLVGENGCGKSTTLKLLTRIMYPDSGTIEMRGRVSSLIELGAGFHPDMSGRQNIYINASIFGLSRKEIERRVNDIIAFSELEEFIDNPVRTYSSGMYMRLAFSVAINVDADILLIDEILAVGDANFQAKCFDKLREIKKQGTTIVIVSHALGQIEQICETSYWIENGKIRMSGAPREVHGVYLSKMGEKRQKNREEEKKKQAIEPSEEKLIEEDKTQKEIEKEEGSKEKRKRFGSQEVFITKVSLLDNEGVPQKVFKSGLPFSIEIEYTAKKVGVEAVFGYAIYNNEGVRCTGTNMQTEMGRGIEAKSHGKVRAIIQNNNLIAGDYKLHLAIYTYDNFPMDDYFDAEEFSIVSDKNDIGICSVNTKWINL